MALPAGLGMVALSLFKEAGLPYAEPSYQRIHEAFLCSVGKNGAIDYGYNIWDHAVITLADKNGAPKNSKRGIGFECLEGLKGIGKYDIFWPTKADKRYKPTDWIDREAETNRVFDMGDNKRLVVRNMSPKEPKTAFTHDGGAVDHHARSGVGALAHKIGNAGNPSWGYLGDLMAEGCANSGKGLMDGHASTHMHVLWGSLGAAMAEPKAFRKYLDEIKWWMIMAQTHNGGFVIMPGRDYASTDHAYGTRNFPSACAALILSVKEKKLRITGATSSKIESSKASSAIRSSRTARTMNEEKIKLLDKALFDALAEISHNGEVEVLPIQISKAHAKVRFLTVENKTHVTFQALQSDAKASFAYADLTKQDRAALARVVAEIRTNHPEAQAMAGAYQEICGQTDLADPYYKKAGEDFTKTINGFFE
jgi:hypothetical protein